MHHNTGVSRITRKTAMGKKIVTEADRKRTPAPKTPEGSGALQHQGRGQRSSLCSERELAGQRHGMGEAGVEAKFWHNQTNAVGS